MDPTASSRKLDHIKLAFESSIERSKIDSRFSYEPFLSPLPANINGSSRKFGAKEMKYPVWVSSMTGGTKLANKINKSLAAMCGKYGLGMGLGSCRQLLHSDEYLQDFMVRELMPNQPLFANLGIAQVEELIKNNALDKIDNLLSKLDADGLIIHVNPLQEWLQPEGDKIHVAPIETIKTILDKVDYPIIVKEVGQGFGKESIKALLSLPLEAVDFAANGGTNFSKIELFRSDLIKQEVYEQISNLGHDAYTMLGWTNDSIEEGLDVKAKQLIISGGVKNFLDGYFFVKSSKLEATYGMASGFLKYALESDEELDQFVQLQLEGYDMAQAMLRINK